MSRVGPAVPFDPELGAALAAPRARLAAAPLSPDPIVRARELDGYMRLSSRDLERGGAFTVDERRVPGPQGAPDVLLVLCRPETADRPVRGCS
ncbi:hypothetical protein [Actinocorallia herbida]|uniref:hypothetical protein n=1 Tax=Actinocorallia herbida TaxID=58109 RepID=UPI00147703EE